jgi:hypothetical protein
VVPAPSRPRGRSNFVLCGDVRTVKVRGTEVRRNERAFAEDPRDTGNESPGPGAGTGGVVRWNRTCPHQARTPSWSR